VRFWLRRHLRNAVIDRYIAVSEATKECLIREVSVPAAKVRVVQNGIRVTAFGKAGDPALRHSLVEGSGLPVIFTPARLHLQKGHRYLLEAAALVPEALFVFAGDGEERKRLEEQTRALGIQQRVRFLGNRSDVPELLACCDLFVLPSLNEGLPLALLEAMAAGKPVIATAIGGTKEVVTNGSTGLLVPPANSRDLAVAIRLLLSDRALADRMGAAGRQHVSAHFSSDAMVEQTIRVYDELTSSPASS
jgi:glycosyltransferase involved in cell wall biosynthesis